MERLRPHGVEPGFTSVIPTIIHIEVSTELKEKDVPVLRLFFKGLRLFTQQYFVRFSTNLLWVMESDCSDIFYAKEDIEGYHRNIIFEVSVINSTYVDILTRIPFVSNKYQMIRRLSRSLRVPIRVDKNETRTLEEMYQKIESYYKSQNFALLQRDFKDPLYLLLIPSFDRKMIFPLLLLGMSKEDAARKYRSVDNKFEDYRRRHYEILIADQTSEEGVCNILRLLQMELEGRERRTSAKAAHGLGELLLAYFQQYLLERGGSLGKSELLFMCVLEDDDIGETLEMVRYRDGTLKSQM